MSETIEQTEVLDPNTITPELRKLMDMAAEQQSESEQSTVPFISLKGKKFSIGDDKLGNVLRVVILADVFDNTWYDRPYDPSSDEIFPPACFAIGNVQSELSPDETSPVKQNDACSKCAKNEFGSASQGKGKACRNGRRILIASVSDDNRVNFGDLAIISMSPTALKGFSKYIKSITAVKKLPIWSVITVLSFDEDSSYPVLVAGYHDILPGVDIEKIVQRLEEFEVIVSQPYDTSTYEPPQSAEESAKKKSKMS